MILILTVGNDDGGTEANYKVVDTDYSNYAVVYDCSPFPGSKNGILVILVFYPNILNSLFSVQNLCGSLLDSRSQKQSLSSRLTGIEITKTLT